MIAELYDEETPITTNNFKSLIEKKFYDGLNFHRVITGFVAQG
jgi:peptidyl-prolyl cis-trans isomerase B (cyclophilin B)